MTLIVCPAATLAEICRSRSPSHVLTIGAPGRPTPRVDAVHHHLVCNDIVEPAPGLVPPDRDLVGAGLAFARGWDGKRPFVISCEFGISRSTAFAFALACQFDPGRSEREHAEELRRAAPCASPNALIVALADALLDRQDRMAGAIASIGRGADYVPYTSFDLRRGPRAGCTAPTGML